MDLKWIAVVLVGCVGLAVCISVALFRPVEDARRHLRPLANVGRLTALPEYVRAIRLRALTTALTVALLLLAFAGSIISAARPTGLPTAAKQSASAQPEDVMVCVGGAASDPAVSASLRFFASAVQTFGTERIGLTSSNRRVVPLTRDYQYAAEQFGRATQGDGADDLVAPVSYVDYAENVTDVLALCLSGFPDMDQKAPLRRSIVYVGPDAVQPAGGGSVVLYDAGRVRDMASAAGIQINAVITGRETGALAALARDTGGQTLTNTSDVVAGLDRIRANPPAPTTSSADQVSSQSDETPDLLVLVALAAVVAAGSLAVVRR